MKNNALRISALLVLCLVLGLFLFSCSKKETYTVTFDTLDGAAATTVTLKGGETPTVPANPTRYGYTFSGWYSDAATTVAVTPSNIPVTQDVTYYAGWIPLESVLIRFDTKGGTAVSPVALLLGDTLNESAVPAPTKEGYTFSGWYKNVSCTAKFNFQAAPTESMTLFAGWKLNDGMGEYIGIVDGTEVARSVFPAGSPVLPATYDGVSYLWFSDIFLTQPFGCEVSTGSVTLYGMAYTEGLQIDGGVVTGYTGRERTVIVPPTWEGTEVTAIGANAFAGNRQVKSVQLPKTVVSVGASAFYDCYSLTTVNLTSACTTIESFAFAGCEKLTDIGDISGLDEIREHTFTGCRRLSSVVFSDSLIAVGRYAFSDCEALESILLPDTVTEIGEYAFSGCSSVREFRIPALLNDLRTGALNGCLSLTNLIPSEDNDTALFRVIDGNLYSAFGHCLSLYVAGDKNETTFTLPAGCTEIAPYAFNGNSNLKVLVLDSPELTLRKGALAGMQALETLSVYSLPSGNPYLAYYFGADSGEANGSAGNYSPDTLTSVRIVSIGDSLPDYAFYGFTGLTSIDGIGFVRTIGKYAFAYTALSDITIPATVTKIGDSAFYGCASIASFTVAPANTAYAAFDDCLYSKDLTTLYLVPQTKESVTFSDAVKTIVSGAFYKSKVRAVVVPSSVTRIEQGAFAGVLQLEELTVPFIGGSRTDTDTDYMMYIFGGTVSKSNSIQPDGTFSYTTGDRSCTPTSLCKLTISEEITFIGEFAFAYLTEVTEINWSGTVTYIDDYAFCQTGLTELTVPNTVTRIGDYAFAAMSDLESAVIPGSVGGNLGMYLFSECSVLESVVFEEGVTKIPAYAFYLRGSRDSETGEVYYYSYLDSVTLPSTVQVIGTGAFAYAGTRYIGANGSTYGNLKFILPTDSDLRVIEKKAFYRSSVKSLALPACFEEVGEMAFFGCRNLAHLTFGTRDGGSSLNKLGGACFAYCTGLLDMTIWKTINSPADVPTAEYYTVTTTTENESFNIFAGATVPSIYVKSAETYRSAEHWDEYDAKIHELTE